MCVYLCVSDGNKIGTQAGGVSSSAEYRRTIWKDEYLGTIWKDSNTTHLWKVNTCWRPHVAPSFNHIPWNIESKRGLAVLFALGFGLAIRVLSQVDARGLSAGTEYILQLCPSVSSLFTLYLIPMNTKYNAARTCVYSVYRQSLCSINTPKSSCRLSKRNLKLLWRLTVRNLTHKGIEEKIFWI